VGTCEGRYRRGVKEQIIKAMFLGGNAEKLADIARSEKVVELRETAVKNLSLLGSPKTGPLLVQIYNTDKNTDIREAVIRGLFIQGNAQALIDLARKETNRDLKHEIIKKLSIMHSKEAVDYMMEFLKE
jgi:HEAT repeat protein